MMEIISLKNRLIPGPLDIKSRLMFHMACYDLDNFRSHIFDRRILDDRNIDSGTLDAVKNDDVELLKLGFQWIKDTLFGEIWQDRQDIQDLLIGYYTLSSYVMIAAYYYYILAEGDCIFTVLSGNGKK